MRNYSISFNLEGDPLQYDLETAFGFYLLESDNEFLGGEMRDFEEMKYPERDGVKVYPHTSRESTTHEITLCAFGKDGSVPKRIADFEKAIKDKRITVHNSAKGFTFNGYHKGIKVEEFNVEDVRDVVVFKWFILNADGTTDLSR